MPVEKKPSKKKSLKSNSSPRRDLAGAAEKPSLWTQPNRWERSSSDQSVPFLRFSPYAWSKLLFLRDLGETEVGGFGISGEEDLFVIEDFVLIKQTCTFATVAFDDESVADFFEEQVDLGREPERFARCWIHTHPGDSADPSGTDEETFARVFGNSSWAVMFILARGGQSYARLKFGCGPRAELLVPIGIDWNAAFDGANHELWKQEYQRCVKPIDSKRFRRTKHSIRSDPESLGDEQTEIVDLDELLQLDEWEGGLFGYDNRLDADFGWE